MAGNSQRVNIGDFVKSPEGEGLLAVKKFVEEMTPDKEPQRKKPSGEPKKPEMSKEEVANTIDDLEKDIEALEDSPELTYEEKIKKHGITLKKAEEIIDSMVVDGYYEETYPVTKKYTITFRTRVLEDQNRILEKIEALRPNYPSTLNNLVAQYNLAASMISFKGIDFSKMEFEDRLDWVRRCPESVVRALVLKLNKFDAMIMDVMSDGSIENF